MKLQDTQTQGFPLPRSNDALLKTADLKLRVYDAVEEFPLDRYTVVFTGRYQHKTGGMFIYMGTCQAWGESDRQIDAPNGWAPAVGRKGHLGKRITFEELPDYFQRQVVETYNYIWDLNQDDAD